MSDASHFIRWELHEHPYRSLPGVFVLDDAPDNARSCAFAVVRVLAEQVSTPRPTDPDPDDLLTDAILPWLERLIPDRVSPFRWTRSIYTRNRIGRHRAASDMNALHQRGILAETFENDSAIETHALQPATDLVQCVRRARRAGAGSLSLLAPPSSTPHSLLEALIALRAAHGERLRLQHCAESLTPLGVIVLSREWDDGGEASREIVLPQATVMPPLPYHRPQ